MGLFLRQDENQTEVQKRVATELQERLRQPITPTDDDHIGDDGRHQTRPAGMVLIVLLALVCVAIIFLAVRIS